MALALAALLGAPPAAASAQLAADKGCLNCHSNITPKKKAPTFKQLAAQYSPLRGQPDTLRERAEKLRSGSIFGHVDAHERLSAEDAAQLVRWLADGAP